MARRAVAARIGALLASALVAAATGVGLWTLGIRSDALTGSFARGLAGHGPDPLAWLWLAALWVPLAQVAFLPAYALLGQRTAAARRSWHLVVDQAALLLVLGLVGVVAAAEGPETRRAIAGLGYVGFVGLKTAVFLHALRGWLMVADPSPRAAWAAVFIGAALPYVLLSGHLTRAISASGDEPYYLLVTHSLVHDGDVDLADNFRARDYLSFYWGPLDPTQETRTTAGGRLVSHAYMGLQPLLLAPGYWLSGRQGAAVTVALLAAAALAFAFDLARRSGVGPGAAFLAWLAVGGSAPMMSFAASPWPEAAAGFFATTAAWLLFPGSRTRLRGAAAAGCLLALVGLKPRFALLALPLLLAFIGRPTRRRLVLLPVVLALALGALTAYEALVFRGQLVGLFRAEGLSALAGRLRDHAVVAALGGPAGLAGLLLDQEYGLLLTAPAFLLGAVGGVLAARAGHWRLLLLSAGPFLLGWSAGGLYPGWWSGFSPPARYLVAALPLLGVLVARGMDRARRGVAWIGVVGLLAVTLGYGGLLVACPAFRFHGAIGRATALLAVWWRTGLDPGGWLPAYLGPDPPGWGPPAALLVVLLGASILALRGDTRPLPGATLLGVLVASATGTALLLGAWAFPLGPYPAVAGQGRGGAPFRGYLEIERGEDVTVEERVVWALQRPGSLELAPRLPAGHYRLIVRAGAQATAPGPGPPGLVVQAGAAPAWRVVLEAAPAPRWREGDYAYDVRWGGGRLPVRLVVDGVSRAAPARLAYVERIGVVRLVPP